MQNDGNEQDFDWDEERAWSRAEDPKDLEPVEDLIQVVYTDDDLDVVMRATESRWDTEYQGAVIYGPDGEVWHIDCPDELERITGIHPGAFWDLGGAR